jgi:hypothetical protein
MLAISLNTIGELLRDSENRQRELAKAYACLPATRCQRKIHCCSMLPEMTLIEALAAIQQMIEMTSALRLRYLAKLAHYFFLNAVEITSCPFLAGRDCVIYPDRFFGCRAYGLWSPTHYGMLAARSRSAKKLLHNQWKKLGISLPAAVVGYQVPYCPDVETIDDITADDHLLISVSKSIESLSRRCSEAHDAFEQAFFSDFSFLITTLLFGLRETLQMKFAVVREVVHTGQSDTLRDILETIWDPLAAADQWIH